MTRTRTRWLPSWTTSCISARMVVADSCVLDLAAHMSPWLSNRGVLNHVVGLQAALLPSQFYEHKLIAAEVLYALLDAWRSLEGIDGDASVHPRATSACSFPPGPPAVAPALAPSFASTFICSCPVLHLLLLILLLLLLLGLLLLLHNVPPHTSPPPSLHAPLHSLTVRSSHYGQKGEDSMPDGFMESIFAGLARLQTTLARMQLLFPNAFRAVHTQV